MSSKVAALGFRVHSGWAAVVAVAGGLPAPEVIERRRIEFADPELPGSKQPYHAAEGLVVKEAESLLQRCMESSTSLAIRAIGECLDEIGQKGHRVLACGILLGSGRALPLLPAIIASHALIHTAEGEFFRRVVIDANTHYGLQVAEVREKELMSRSDAELRISRDALEQHLLSLARTLGPPWREDQKLATMVACLALARSRVRTH